MIVHTPRAVHIIMPDTLQISRQIARTRAGNQQIAAELVIQFFQIKILLTTAVQMQPFSNRHVAIVLVAQVQLHPVEQRRIILHMFLEQGLVTLSGCFLHPGRCRLFRIYPHIRFRV